MRLITIFILFCNSVVWSQNLVPNSSFEEINDIISKFTKDNIEFMNKIKNWSTPNSASPDLITPDFDEKYIKPPSPHTGSNMIGIQFNKIDWFEYIGVNLTKELIPNRTYCVEYWIRRSQCINPSMNIDQIMDENFGILFSLDSIKTSNGNAIISTPQVKVDTQLLVTYREWLKVSELFTPKYKYDKLYLGQFREEGKASLVVMGYYVIDDISVKEITDFELLDSEIELPIGSIIPLKNIHFISGTTGLTGTKSYDLLKELTTYLNENPSIRIRINGHTDSKGSEKSNLLLSKRRAKSIAKFIIENGISRDRIEWKGFGEEHPIADNEFEEGRLKNRRVEFEVVK
jgi:outer membrane protein OmpA-like peptidoglycan-associated protein